ncbi:LamG-like jellyroll fold domain-containing protein [Cellulosimicrobium sp. NPDC057127]|uniref:LamG-like jellyroll fold domain-containing protein n=1 Tax=Cellulosimicrobium sp. NPDC057127 TaxID=3346026 RepID=UPI0036266746
MLDDPDTTWPVFIDPSVSGSRNAWTLIRSAVPNTVAGYKFSGSAGLGLCDPGATSACTRSNDVHRLVWHFYGLDVIGSMGPLDIASATFTVFGEHSWSCSPTGVQAYATGPVTSATTWNNHVSSWGTWITSQNLAHRESCGNRRDVEFNVIEGAKLQAREDWRTLAIGLKASNEGSMAGSWKRYRGDARLSVTYNRAPNAPLGMSTSDPVSKCVMGPERPFIRSTTPTLRVTLSDPDGGTIRGNFDVHRLSDYALVFRQSTTTYLASGGTHAMPVPSGRLVDGTTYRWVASGTDQNGRSEHPGFCEFTVDVTRPARPVVSSSVFPDGVPGADVGTAGSFSFGPGGSSDVVAYKYSFGSDALDRTASVALGGSTTVSFTPTSVVPVTLSVQSVDRAGNTSDRVDYLIRPSVPAKVGYWSLDEGSGSVAGDQPGAGMTPHPLTVSGGASWVPGAGVEFDPGSPDKGLSFDGSTAAATSSGPVVATDKTFAVNAMVRTDVVDGQPRTAVSQDGQHASRFGLGVSTGDECPAEAGLSCWAFWLNGEDASAPARVVSASAVPVVADQWVSLTGVYDATTGTAQLWVCRPLQFEEPAPAGAVSAGTPWVATGAFALGQAQAAGQPTQRWDGVVSSVRAYASVPTDEQRYRDCNPLGS